MTDDRTSRSNPGGEPATTGPAPTPASKKPLRERARSLFASLAIAAATIGGFAAVNRACIKTARRAWKASDDAATAVLKGSDDAAAAAKASDGSLTSEDVMDAGLEAASQSKDWVKQKLSNPNVEARDREGKGAP